jgi:hypothetical protein
MRPSRHRIYNIEELLSLVDDGNRWLVPNMIPRVGRTIVYGHGGTYKTTILFDICVSIATGGMLLRHWPIATTGERRPVLIISTESSIYNNKDRIAAHIRARETSSAELAMRGGKAPIPNKEEMPIYYCQNAFDLDDVHEKKAFQDTVEELKPALILLDPLDSFLTGDENSAKETKNFRRTVDHLIEEHETSVVVIHHSTKDKENPSIRGSGAWRGWTDTALFFQKQSTEIGGETLDYVDVRADKQRDGREGLIFSVIPEIDEVRGMVTFSLINDGIDPDEITHNTVTKKVYEYLAIRGASTQKDICAGTTYSYKRVQAALSSLAADGVAAHDGVVMRSTSEDGSRQRSVPAWRIVPKTSFVDKASALLKAKLASDRRDEETYSVDLVGPVGAVSDASDNGHVGQTHDGAVPQGPGVPTVH